MQNLRPLIIGIVSVVLAVVMTGFFYTQQQSVQTIAGTDIGNARNQAGNAGYYRSPSSLSSGNLTSSYLSVPLNGPVSGSSPLSVPAAYLLNPSQGAISLYVKLNNGASGPQGIFDTSTNNHTNLFGLNLGARVVMNTTTTNIVPALPPPGVWTRYVLTWGPAGLTAYANGQFVGSDASFTSISTEGDPVSTLTLLLGGGWANAVQGEVKNVTVYSQQLTTSQVSALGA